MDLLPCGCRMGQEVVKATGEKAFVIKPCRVDCEYYVYAQRETQRQAKAIRFVAEASWNREPKP